MEHTTPQGTQFEGVLKGHEERDADIPKILTVVGILLVYIFVVAAGLGVLFFAFIKSEIAKDTIPAAVYKSSFVAAPESAEQVLVDNEKAEAYLPSTTETPPLMPDPHQPLITLRKQEMKEVHGYGYVEDADGKRIGVHIPVERAMQLYLERGVQVEDSPSPLRPPAPVSPALEPAQDKGI